MVASAESPLKPRLLIQLRDCIRTKHHVLSAEKVYALCAHVVEAHLTDRVAVTRFRLRLIYASG